MNDDENKEILIDKWIKWKANWVSEIVNEFEKIWMTMRKDDHNSKLIVCIAFVPDMTLSKDSLPGCNIFIGNNSQFWSSVNKKYRGWESSRQTITANITMPPNLYKEFAEGPLLFVTEMLREIVEEICNRFFEDFEDHSALGLFEKREKISLQEDGETRTKTMLFVDAEFMMDDFFRCAFFASKYVETKQIIDGDSSSDSSSSEDH